MSGWKGRDLPAGWEKLRQQRKKMAGGRCEVMSQIRGNSRTIYGEGTRCVRKGSELDHVGDRDDHRIEMLRWTCWPHHRAKTSKQSAAARWPALPARPQEPHPGAVAKRQERLR